MEENKYILLIFFSPNAESIKSVSLRFTLKNLSKVNKSIDQ